MQQQVVSRCLLGRPFHKMELTDRVVRGHISGRQLNGQSLEILSVPHGVGRDGVTGHSRENAD